jgi:glucan phosphoethanolaminetransferase (alkaline phosphatase superfamily)
MLIVGLFILLFLSFSIHVLIVVLYVSSRSKALFNAFLVTALSNVCIGIVLSIFALNEPEKIHHIDFKFILWILSGFVMAVMLLIKILFFKNIYKRTKDPANYHFNYFGKKVYNKGLVRQYEFFTLMLSMPVFFNSGSLFYRAPY